MFSLYSIKEGMINSRHIFKYSSSVNKKGKASSAFLSNMPELAHQKVEFSPLYYITKCENYREVMNSNFSSKYTIAIVGHLHNMSL